LKAWLWLTLLGAACAGPPHRAPSRHTWPPAQPTVVQPAGAQQAVVPPVQDVHADRVLASADKSPPLPGPDARAGTRPTTVTYRTFVKVVEIPVEVPAGPSDAADFEAWTGPAAVAHHEEDSGGPDFPVMSVLGAGVGAVIGNQSGNSEAGALIGSSIGMLFDFARWWH
jgi:hypothetical protein